MQEDEDAPMSLVVDPKARTKPLLGELPGSLTLPLAQTGRIAYGANQASKFMSKGENDNLRTLHFENGLCVS